jgi:dihydrofolate reductase
MKIIMVDAVSLNGKITDSNGQTHTWTSAEDWDEFLRLRDASDVIVMGAATYEAVRPKPDASIRRVVLTHHPEKYQAAAVPEQLEFVTETAQTLVKRLQKAGCKRVMVAGGTEVNSDFLSAGLADELYLTFEPVLLGSGTPLLAERSLQVGLRLQSVRQLNAQGTLLAHYIIDR